MSVPEFGYGRFFVAFSFLGAAPGPALRKTIDEICRAEPGKRRRPRAEDPLRCHGQMRR